MLDLSACGPRLWPLLDEAARVGLPLVQARSQLGELPRYRRGEILLDVTRPADTHALVRALLRLDGDEAERLGPALFLGASGHGVVCADGLGGLCLVRLTRPT